MKSFVLKTSAMLTAGLLFATGAQAEEARMIGGLNHLFRDQEVLAMLDDTDYIKDVVDVFGKALERWQKLEKHQRVEHRNWAKEAKDHEEEGSFDFSHVPFNDLGDQLIDMIMALKRLSHEEAPSPASEPAKSPEPKIPDHSPEPEQPGQGDEIVEKPKPTPMRSWDLWRKFDWAEQNIQIARTEADQSSLVLLMLNQFFDVSEGDTHPPSCFEKHDLLWVGENVEYNPKWCHFDDETKQQTPWEDLTETERTHFTLKYRQAQLIEKFVMKIDEESFIPKSRMRWIKLIQQVFPNDKSERKRLIAGFKQVMSDTTTDDWLDAEDVDSRRLSQGNGIRRRLGGLVMH